MPRRSFRITSIMAGGCTGCPLQCSSCWGREGGGAGRASLGGSLRWTCESGRSGKRVREDHLDQGRIQGGPAGRRVARGGPAQSMAGCGWRLLPPLEHARKNRGSGGRPLSGDEPVEETFQWVGQVRRPQAIKRERRERSGAQGGSIFKSGGGGGHGEAGDTVRPVEPVKPMRCHGPIPQV